MNARELLSGGKQNASLNMAAGEAVDASLEVATRDNEKAATEPTPNGTNVSLNISLRNDEAVVSTPTTRPADTSLGISSRKGEKALPELNLNGTNASLGISARKDEVAVSTPATRQADTSLGISPRQNEKAVPEFNLNGTNASLGISARQDEKPAPEFNPNNTNVSLGIPERENEVAVKTAADQVLPSPAPDSEFKTPAKQPSKLFFSPATSGTRFSTPRPINSRVALTRIQQNSGALASPGFLLSPIGENPTNQHLQTLIKEKEVALQALQSELEEQNKALSELLDENKKYYEELCQFDQVLAEFEPTNILLAQTIQEKEKLVGELSEYKSIQTELEKTRRNLQTESATNESLQAQLADSKRASEELKAQLADAQQKTAAELESTKQSLAQVTQQKEKLSGELLEYQSIRAQLESTRSSLQTERTTNQSLQTQLTDSTSKLNQLIAQLADAERKSAPINLLTLGYSETISVAKKEYALARHSLANKLTELKEPELVTQCNELINAISDQIGKHQDNLDVIHCNTQRLAVVTLLLDNKHDESLLKRLNQLKAGKIYLKDGQLSNRQLSKEIDAEPRSILNRIFWTLIAAALVTAAITAANVWLPAFAYVIQYATAGLVVGSLGTLAANSLFCSKPAGVLPQVRVENAMKEIQPLLKKN